MTVDAEVGTGGLLGPQLARRAEDAVLLVADRMADPATVAGLAVAPHNRDAIFDAPVWDPVALSHGHPGVAVMYGELTRRDPRWQRAADEHLRAAVAALTSHPSNGLYYGPAAVAAAAQSCAGARGQHYARLRGRLADWVAGDQTARLEQAHQRQEPGVSWAAYDVINGLTGSARILLDAARMEDGVAAEAARVAVRSTLEHLVRLSGRVRVAGTEVPAWWVPPELEPVDQDREDYPRGDFNLGMAHGVAGPMSLLTTAATAGFEVPGLLGAIHRYGEWLVGWVMRDAAGPYWPCRVSWDDETGPNRPDTQFTRTAWCYGAPGVASALYRAAGVVDRPDWRDLAVASLRAALSRDVAAWRLDGPTVCHGYAGFLQVLVRIGVASRDPELLVGIPRVTGLVLDHLDLEAPFGFRHLTPDSPRGWREATRHRPLDIAGLLEGAAGVACALLSATTPAWSPDPDPVRADAPSWDRVLMLS